MEILSIVSSRDYRQLEDDLFGKEPIDTKEGTYRIKTRVKLHEHAELKMYPLQYRTASADSPQSIQFLIEIGKDIAIGIAGAYIYDKLRNYKDAKLRIGEKLDVAIIKDEIIKAIREEFERLKNDEGQDRS